MRMVHYYVALGCVCLAALVATVVTGIFRDASETHLWLGLSTSILCVATNTILILFMIVTGRVLKVAIRTRPLRREFLDELNAFFARRGAYPAALVAAASAAGSAVLGYGRFIGVPIFVHEALGLVALLVNLLAFTSGCRSLRANQALLDRAARELDRLDREGVRFDPAAGGPDWAYSRSARWAIFALCAWLPYLYWGLVVWRGAFREVPDLLLALSALGSILGAIAAWSTRERHQDGDQPSSS